MDINNHITNVAFGKSAFVKFPTGHSIPNRYSDAIKFAKTKRIISQNTPQKAIGTILSDGGCLVYDTRTSEGKILNALSEKINSFFNNNELKDTLSLVKNIIIGDKNTVKIDYKA